MHDILLVLLRNVQQSSGVLQTTQSQTFPAIMYQMLNLVT